jgi:7-cyano-7-deazaguanine synthase
MKKCVLLYSGGIDSTNTVVVLKDKRFEIFPLFIDYCHKARTEELKSARYFTSYFKLNKLKIMDFNHYNNLKHPLIRSGKISLIKDLKRSETTSINYLPYRNLVFAILGVIYGKYINARYLSFGFIKDTITRQFPDTSYDFVSKLNDIIKLIDSHYNRIQIISETLNYSKSDLIEYGIKKRIPLKKTYSCYYSAPRCGECESCLQVINAFKKLSRRYKPELLKQYYPYATQTKK